MSSMSLFEKGRKIREQEEIAKQIQIQQEESIQKYADLINSVEQQYNNLVKLLQLNSITEKDKLIVSLKVYISQIPNSKPKSNCGAAIVFAEKRILFLSQLLSEIQSRTAHDHQALSSDFLEQNIEKFDIKYSCYNELCFDSKDEAQKTKLYAIGYFISAIAFPLSMAIVLFLTFHFMTAVTIYPALFAVLMGAAGGIVGGLLCSSGLELRKMLERTQFTKSNEEILNRDKNERTELITYAKELLSNVNMMASEDNKLTGSYKIA